MFSSSEKIFVQIQVLPFILVMYAFILLYFIPHYYLILSFVDLLHLLDYLLNFFIKFVFLIKLSEINIKLIEVFYLNLLIYHYDPFLNDLVQFYLEETENILF